MDQAIDVEVELARQRIAAALASMPAGAMRPQDAYAITGEIEQLLPAMAALLRGISDRLAAAAHIPGLYTTSANADARSELASARSHLAAAAAIMNDAAFAHLDDARESLAALGHSDTTHSPLIVVADPFDNPSPAP